MRDLGVRGSGICKSVNFLIPDFLIPDYLTPDSLIPDSLIP